jgi:hypothetical protein
LPRIGAPAPGFYREILNSESSFFGGSNMGNAGGITARDIACHNSPYTLSITLPPLAVVAFELYDDGSLCLVVVTPVRTPSPTITTTPTPIHCAGTCSKKAPIARPTISTIKPTIYSPKDIALSSLFN